MKCCICGCSIDGYGNNPYPLCAEEDVESRCCNECNDLVIKARLVAMHGLKRKEIKENDTVVIFYSVNSDSPITSVTENGKFIAGKATKESTYAGQWEGTWGNFILDTDKDSYVIIEG